VRAVRFLRRKRAVAVPAAYAVVSEDDREILAALLAEGADLDRPREVQHFCDFPDGATARAAAADLEHAGWVVEVGAPDEHDDAWSVQASRAGHVLTPAAMVADAELLTSVAARHGGEYDGWGATA
jgi:regulator of ribonuclease activity B